MPTYVIGLSQTYLINIQAENLEAAESAAESLVGETNSLIAIPEDRNFVVEKIELLESDVFEV